MNHLPTVVSFFTRFNDSNYYGRHASRLKAECDNLGLRWWIKEVQFNDRPWEQVLKEKPGVILQALRETATPVLWIDVDGSILQRPAFIEKALTERPTIDLMAVPKLPEKGRPFYMGAVFYNCTEGAKEFLREWQDEYAKEDSEELAFGRAYNKIKGMLNFTPLPKDYMRIDGIDPIVKSTVVIHRLSKGDTKKAFYARMGRKR